MYLLDTNALLFYLYQGNRLSDKAGKIIYGDERLYVSIVSLWEIAVKASLGKLAINSSIEKIAYTCRREGMEILPVRERHLDALLTMEWHHRDPFDRLIVATAMVENMAVISSDSVLSMYEIRVVW